ncbi:MAG: hypothetical protein QXZ28_05475 [Candidatus Methanomethylicaceae archaeon]
MGDVMESLEIANMEREVRKAELILNLRRMELRRVQLQDELRRLEENYQATKKALLEMGGDR